jgi:hypothetical protein
VDDLLIAVRPPITSSGYAKRTVVIVRSVLQAHWGADPIVSDRLVGLDHDTVTLTGVDIQMVNGEGIMVDSINFDDLEGVSSDGDGKITVSRSINEAETVAETFLNVNPGPWRSWTTDVTTLAIDGTTVRDWLVTTTVIIAEVFLIEPDGGCMVPVRQYDNSICIVNVIEAEVRILKVVDD